MSPRPKRVSDGVVIEAAWAVAQRRGAAGLRLADVAAVSGLAPATLVQRFGTREALLDAVGAALAGRVAAAFTGSAPSHVERMASALGSLDAAAHLSFLALRPASGHVYADEIRKQVGFAIAQAVENNELPHCDVASLARRIQIAYLGSVIAAQLEGRSMDREIARTLVADVLADLG